MKFSATNWTEIDGNQLSVNNGRVYLRSSKPAVFYVTQSGVQAIAGFGHEVDITLTGPAIVHVEAPASSRLFQFTPFQMSLPDEQARFTNVDRTPLDEHANSAVMRLIRQQALADQSRRRSEQVEQANERLKEYVKQMEVDRKKRATDKKDVNPDLTDSTDVKADDKDDVSDDDTSPSSDQSSST